MSEGSASAELIFTAGFPEEDSSVVRSGGCWFGFNSSGASWAVFLPAPTVPCTGDLLGAFRELDVETGSSASRKVTESRVSWEEFVSIVMGA